MEEEPIEEKPEEDPFVDYTVRDFATTNHIHYYIEDPTQDPNTNLTSVMCTGCPSGISMDANEFEIKDGKVFKRKK